MLVQKTSLPSTGNNGISTVWQNKKGEPSLAVLYGWDNPCGRDEEPTHSRVDEEEQNQGVMHRYQQLPKQSLLVCHMQMQQCSHAEFAPQGKMPLDPQLLANTRSCCVEHAGRAAIIWLPVVIFIVLITAIINNAVCSSILILKTQIAINILNARQ